MSSRPSRGGSAHQPKSRPVRRTVAQRARATLARVAFPSGMRVNGIELSPHMTREERRALEFWIRRLPAGFAARLPRLKLAVADQLGSARASVFINEVSPENNSSHPNHLHAASFIRQRYVVLRRELFRRRVELGRILYHELGHFLWPRLGNPLRQSYDALLRQEFRDGTRGELGYSAELRKGKLRERIGSGKANPSRDRKRAVREGSRRPVSLWREYVCESFCDTAAYVLLGLERRVKHSEYTLSRAARACRCRWVAEVCDLPPRVLPATPS